MSDYDSRSDALKAYREEVPYQDDDRPSDLYDPEAILVRVTKSLSIVCDFVEGGKPDDLANALEMLNFCIDDVEDIVELNKAGP